MTCEGCAIHISHAVSEIEGVINASVLYENGVAEIRIDASRTSPEVIAEAINTTGYKVTSWKMK